VKLKCPDNELLVNPVGAECLKASNWRWALDFTAETKHGLFSLETLRCGVSTTEGIPAEFIPVHFVFRNKVTRYDEMLLTFDGVMLSEILGCDWIEPTRMQADWMPSLGE
jgi:hypothetical protein